MARVVICARSPASSEAVPCLLASTVKRMGCVSVATTLLRSWPACACAKCTSAARWAALARWSTISTALAGKGLLKASPSVVRARATLGDAFSNPLPAKAVLIVDQRANAAQRAALVHFAQAQAGQLLSNVVATETQPIRFTVDASKHGTASLEAGDLAQITTRAITDTDEICHNEEVYYEPLVSHLTHAMPAVASQSSYRGNHLGSTWNESNRRSAFIATFAV